MNPDEDVISSGLISKKLLFSKIEIALAGRAAETIVFGKNEITQCSIKDIKVTSEKLYEDNVIADPTAKSKNKTKSKTTKTSKSVKAKPKK